jgi:outer membrane protein
MLTPQRRLGRLLSAAAVALAFVGGAGVAPALISPAQASIPQVRGVAVVDMQKVLSETKQGQAARKKLEDSSKAKQEKLDQKRKKLEADTNKLKNLQGEKLAQAEEALQKEYMEMQQIYMTMQEELAQQESRVLADIYKNCQTLIDKLAAEKNVDLVLIRDDATVLYVQPNLDITAELVKRYNAKFPS